MERRLLLAAVACFAAIALVLVWRSAPRGTLGPVRPERSAPTGALHPVGVETPQPIASEAEAPRARESAAAIEEPIAVERPSGVECFALEVLALDLEDQPVPNAEVFVAPLDGAWNRVGTTDRDGRARICLEARDAKAEIALALGRNGRPAPPMRRVALEVHEVARVALGTRQTPPAAASVSSTVRKRAAQEQDGARPSRVRSEILLRSQVEIVARAPDPAALDPKGAPGPEAPNCGAPPPVLADAWTRDDGVLRLREPDANASELDHAPRPTEALDAWARRLARNELADDGAVQGVVLTADGKPAAGVRVAFRVDDALELAARTDRFGRYALRGLVPGEHALVAGGGDFGRASAKLEVRAGEVREWNVELARGLELAAQLVDERAKPVVNAWIELERDGRDPPLWDATRGDAEGRFAIPNLPEGAARLFAGTLDQPYLPALALDFTFGGRAEERLALHAEERASASVAIELRFEEELVAQEGFEAPLPELRLWQLDTGRGIWLARAPRGGGGARRSGRYAASPLPAGRYELWAGAPGRRWLRFGPFALAPGHVLELGGAMLAQPGRLRLEPEERVARLRVLRDGGGLAVEIGALGPGDAGCELPEGDYLLAPDPPRGDAARFAIEPGREARVAPPD